MINLLTHIYSKNFVDAIHVIEATYNFPDHCVQSRAQTTTCYNTGMHFIWLKINLNSIKKLKIILEVFIQRNNINNICLTSHSNSKLDWDRKEQTLCRGPARRKCVPLGLLLWTTIFKYQNTRCISQFLSNKV